MNCEPIKTFDFCTTKGNTVFAKEFNIVEFTNEHNLKLEIYDFYKKVLETIQHQRKNENTWVWQSYKEAKNPADYRYVLSYLQGNVERIILKGKITVNPKV